MHGFLCWGGLLAQHGYGVLLDKRVKSDIPTAIEIVAVGRSYSAFLVAFVLVYGWGVKSAVLMAPIQGDRFQAVMITSMATLLILIKFLVERLFGIGGGSYIQSYTGYRHLTLITQQILNELSQLSFAASVAAMVYIIAWRPRFHRYVAMAIFVSLLVATFFGGSRAFGVLMAFAYLVCVSIYVCNFHIRHLLILAVAGFMLFMLAGVIRAGHGFGLLMLAPFQGGEFFSVFVNSVDFLRKSAEGGIIAPWQFYWVDILRFIPQQFWGFEKLDPSVWYVKTYYPDFHGEGGGVGVRCDCRVDHGLRGGRCIR